MRIGMRAQTVIDRPAADVFSFVAVNHCANHPRWDPAVLRIVPPAGGVMALDSRLDIVRRTLGREETLTFEVTEWEPPRRMTITTRSRDFDLSLASEIEPLDGGRSRLVLNADARIGGLRTVLVPLMRMKFGAEIRHNLFRIKGFVEAGTRASAAPAV
jgi:Polyketide cyclase / dehydrase and lipid transport